MARVVIFGIGDLASLAWYVLTHDSPHEVAGFTVDAAYVANPMLHDLPVVPFETVEARFPPPEARMIVPVGWRDINGLRASRHRAAKAKGYAFVSYVSSRASVWPDLIVGENCMIFDGAIVQPFARIGDGVIIRSGGFLSHHVTIADNCFLAPRVCLGGGVEVGERCFLGLNATVNPHVKVARCCLIGAGAVVCADTAEDGIYFGVPARRQPGSADRHTRSKPPRGAG